MIDADSLVFTIFWIFCMWSFFLQGGFQSPLMHLVNNIESVPLESRIIPRWHTISAKIRWLQLMLSRWFPDVTVEIATAIDLLPSVEPTTAAEERTTADTAPVSPPAPSSGQENLDDMLANTPPATGEASGFGHLRIPRATRVVSRSTESDSDKEKMEGLPWQCLINKGMHVGNRSVVLVNEGFVRAQHLVDDLKAQLDAQSRETEKFKLLLREKKDELSRATAPPNLQSELEAAKRENLHLKAELDDAVEKNKLLDGDNKNLSRENADFVTKLGEFEATIAQLREGLDSIKVDAEKREEKIRQLEAERVGEKEKLRVFKEKVETRARISDELKGRLEEAILANNILQTELASVNEVRITLIDMKSELEERLKKAQADMVEACKDVEAAEAHSTLLVEHERWKYRRVTLEQVERGMEDIPLRILDARMIEDKAKKALEDSSEDDSEETVSENSGSTHTE
ncbi:uncharacterized protein LOC132624240 [Lycium barbarum]|uniref:uncharacterized protein LOC132624240 n=1 Tax=Lycium barbarum TaxID=112863 RepID=UPI00293F64B7|nr:uncharacterized protein LOC132624240 [Lycium barbarum]